MVLIEPETKQTESRGKTRIQKKVRVEESAAERKSFSEDVNNSIKTFISDMKNLFTTIKSIFTGMDVKTVGMPPQKKANHYLKKCWHHMSRNEVDEAKKAYEHLVDIYEGIEEGPLKTNLYQEVFDIYQRISEVK